MICVAICTRQRPELLRRMLNSCANVTSELRKGLIFLVVENGPASYGEAIVSEFTGRLNIFNINEPRIGLVNARNSAIEFFLKTDADWFASVDDDGTISTEWIEGYLAAQKALPDARVFAGPTPQIELEYTTKWYQYRKMPIRPLGYDNWRVSTANTLIKRDIFSSDGENMRFDMRNNLSGGEDTQFFRRLYKKKIPILWVPTAVILERVDERRGEFGYRIRRDIEFWQNRGKIEFDEYGIVGGIVANVWLVILSIITVALTAIAGIVVLIFSRSQGQRIISRSWRTSSIVVGRLRALFFKRGADYASTDGS